MHRQSAAVPWPHGGAGQAHQPARNQDQDRRYCSVSRPREVKAEDAEAEEDELGEDQFSLRLESSMSIDRPLE